MKAKKKPFMWYYHKIMCEINYYLHIKVDGFLYNKFNIVPNLPFLKKYYYHLNIMCNNYKINLYGEII